MKYALVILVLLAVIGGSWYFAQKEPATTNQESTEMESTSAEDSQSATEESSASTTQKGAFIEYSGSAIASTTGTKILFFHAPWCPQCRALEADIKANTIPENVTIMKVDYDSNQTLRKKYGVTIQTTLVRVDDSGNLVEKYVAYDSPTLQAVAENLF